MKFYSSFQEFEKKKSFVIAIEESYLSRRVSATLLGRIQKTNANDFISFAMIPSGSRNFRSLTSLHNELEILALFWIVGEVDRLSSYSKATGNQLFSEKIAFGTTTMEQEMNNLISKLRTHYNFSYISDVILKDRELILQICSPNYSNT
jgi:hypothetical protein